MGFDPSRSGHTSTCPCCTHEQVSTEVIYEFEVLFSLLEIKSEHSFHMVHLQVVDAIAFSIGQKATKFGDGPILNSVWYLAYEYMKVPRIQKSISTHQ